ncbi:MFS transporter [Salarchaeum sp. III]|uniref:MFS transporter n=1 Tax=Salarchaeum sp. III TaxID=3107927 RepID=UPI002EDA4D63
MGIRSRFQPAVLAVALATFACFLGIGIVDPILPSIARELGASHFMVEFLFTSYLLVMGVSMLFAGALATRIGSKTTLLAGLAIVAVFSGLCYFAQSVETLAVLRGFWGLGNALFTTTALAILVGVATGNAERAIGLYEASLGFGIACGPLIGGVLGRQAWQLPFAGASVILAAAFVFSALTVTEPDAERQQTVRDVVATFRHTGVRTNALVGLLYTFGFFTLLAYTPLILDLATFELGLVFFAWGMLVIVGSAALAPRLNRRFGTPEVTRATLSVFAVVFAVMWLSDGSTSALAALTVAAGLLCGVLNANLTTLAMGISGHGRSRASGAFNSLRFTGGALAPITAGYVGQQYSATTPYVLGALALLAGIGLLSARFGEFRFTAPDAQH